MEKDDYINNINHKKNIKNGGTIMAVLAKPLDVAFVVKESKANDFINRKRDTNKKLKGILQKAKKMEGNIMHKE